jgi:hypothetical protein
MKKILIILFGIILLSTKIWGQVTIHSNNCATTTAGWTYTNGDATLAIQQGGYWLIEKSGDTIISQPFDVSAYINLTLTFQVATYSGGTNNPCKVEYSTDNGLTWNSSVFISSIPIASSPYISAGTWNLGTILSTQLKIRWTKNNIDKGVRIKNILFQGVLPSGGIFEIESILVDACGSPQGANEMVRFQIGTAAMNTSNLIVSWPSNSYLGICQNATTASIVAAINSTITGGGQLIEPSGGILPAGAQVMLFTSTAFNYNLFNFSALNYPIYAIFQCPGNTNGHFVNHTATSTPRTLVMAFSGFGSDAVTYDANLVFNGAGGAVDYTAAGVPTYGITGAGCFAPLFPMPIELINFTAKCYKNEVEIKWETASQTNNEFFTIERSNDAQNWEPIATLNGAGNSNEHLYYSHFDTEILNNILYYRLKQTDYDGTSTYSTLKSVNCNDKVQTVVYHPNPFNNELLFDTYNITCDEATVEVTDIIGRTVLKTKLYNIANDNSTFRLNVSSLSSGTYTIQFKSDAFNNIAKIIK